MQSHHRSLKSVEKIVEEWVAVEEASVGGIIHLLLPPIVKMHIKDLPPSHIEADIISKSQFEK